MKNRNLDHKDHWQTNPEFLEKLNKRYHFDFDPCPLNHNLDEWDGLDEEMVWGGMNFINPGYSLKTKTDFVVEALRRKKIGCSSVLLLPVSTSTKLFHETIKPNARVIEFIEGRLDFIGTNQYGQKVNHHLIQKTTNEKILILNKSGKKEEMSLYIKAKGQHDSMIVEFI